MKTSEHKGLWHKYWNGTELRCSFSDPKEVNAGCVSVCSNQSNHILSHPGTRSSWVNFASVWIQIFFLFMPNTIHKSICFLSRRFAEAWSSFTKSHLCCAMQLINPELSFGMKTPFKVSVISTLTGLLICKFFLSLHHSASVKKEQDFNKWFLLASTFHNTERCPRSSSENPGMMLSLKTRSFQGH